jgi:hypothetical protein
MNLAAQVLASWRWIHAPQPAEVAG